MQSKISQSSPPGRRKESRISGFSTRQMLILVLLGLAGAAALGATAFILFSTDPKGSSAAAPGTASPTISAVPPQSTATMLLSQITIPADCAQATTQIQEVQARVIDGQTLEVTLEGRSVSVRFAGIKFPAEGSEATAFLESEIAGQAVILARDSTDQDASGSMVRYVFAGSRFINEDLVRQGFARADINAADRACIIPFQLSEQQARIDRLGIWRATPVPTATFIPFVTLDASQQSCDCSQKYTCSDFQTHAAAQACFNACNDYSSKLDENHDGVACENLP